MEIMNSGSSQPLYLQLKEHLKRQIDTGELKPGDRILSEAGLVKKYNLSRVTVRRAIEELVKAGYLIKIQGKGTFVSQVAEFEAVKNIRSFTKICQMQGHDTIADVRRAELTEGTEELCSFLNLSPGSQVMLIERVRKVDGVPVVLEKNYFHPFCEFLKMEDLTGSLYEILIEKYYIFPSKKGLNKVEIANVNKEEAKLLKITEGMAVIKNHVHVYDENDNPVHVVEELVRVDQPEIFKYYL